MQIYIVMGRVCDLEDHVKVVFASSKQEAETTFESAIRTFEENMEGEFYIEFCTTLGQAKLEALTSAPAKKHSLAQEAFYLASGLYITNNCYNDNNILDNIDNLKCQHVENECNKDVHQYISDTADVIIQFYQSQALNLTKASVKATVRNVIEQHDSLSMDDKDDRELLISHLISNLET
jgi:hypothetical protein